MSNITTENPFALGHTFDVYMQVPGGSYRQTGITQDVDKNFTVESRATFVSRESGIAYNRSGDKIGRR